MLQPDLLLARKAGKARQDSVKVRLGKRDFLLPYENWGRLVRITNHPINTNKFLVWRKMEGSGPNALHTLTVNEASRVGDSLRQGREVADLIYWVLDGKNAFVYDFRVKPAFRRETLGSALGETMMQDLQAKGVRWIKFPAHKEEEFYTKRGFRKIGLDRRGLRGAAKELASIQPGGAGEFLGFMAKVKELGVKPKGIRLKVLWQRAKPRFA